MAALTALKQRFEPHVGQYKAPSSLQFVPGGELDLRDLPTQCLATHIEQLTQLLIGVDSVSAPVGDLFICGVRRALGEKISGALEALDLLRGAL